MNLYYNIKTKTYWLISLIILGLVVVSCQEPLDTDYSGYDEGYLFVDGKITTDTTRHCVKLSRTVSLDESEMNWETNAQVSIINGSTIYPLTEVEDGHYYTSDDVYGVIGGTYELSIETDNGETYTATTTIPNISEIDSVKFIWEEYMYGYYFHELYFHGWELEEEGNYYLWNLTINDTLYNDTLTETTYVSDEFVNGKYIGIDNTTGESSYAIYYLDADEIHCDTSYVTVSMESYDEDYYDFLNSLMDQTVNTGSMFDAAKADLTTNVSGDGLGFFYGASVRYYSFVYIRPEESVGWENP